WSIPEREDPRDAFVSRSFHSLEELPEGARLGTSSLRRAAQLKAWRADLQIVSIRGNVQTRIRKIDEELDGGVLAAAGLKRLGLQARIAEIIPPERMLPAVGQGALALEVRAADADTRRRVEALEHRDTRIAVSCERAFLARMGGGCQVPIAAHATVDGDRLAFRGLVGEPDGTRTIEYRDAITFRALEEVERLGTEAADRVIAQGAAELLARVYTPGGVPES
ncbi:MAG: hydroxymethylbilane synthase, partial [Myxococcales bacterium]